MILVTFACLGYTEPVPSLIVVNNTRDMRLINPNVERSAMLVDSSDSKMRVGKNGGGDWSFATIAWDDRD